MPSDIHIEELPIIYTEIEDLTLYDIVFDCSEGIDYTGLIFDLNIMDAQNNFMHIEVMRGE
jgi:hypothetical protein